MADFSLLEIAGINGPTYEAFYKEQNFSASGDIVAQDVAPFLKKFGLSDIILSQIWALSDTSQRGMLNKQEFFLALKLIALVQNEKEPSLSNVTLNTVPAPKLMLSNSPAFPGGRSSFSTTTTTNSRSIPCISNEEVKSYRVLFEQLHPVDGKVSGQQVKGTLVQSNLPVEVLGKLWDLSDIDKDGALDEEEFVLIMYLLRRCREGEPLPDVVPAHLLNSSRKRSLLLSIPTTSSAVKAPTPATDWAVPLEERTMYEPLFYIADQDRDGFVSGLEIKDTFMKSGLPQPILAQIWALCDTKTAGKLNLEQFILAMHLIHQQLSSFPPELPTSLPFSLVPPSMRSDLSGAKPLSLADFGIPIESDRVFAEVEAIRKEREEVERACYHLELQNSQRSAEVGNVQRAVDQALHTKQQLEQQKSEAEAKLAEYHQRKETMEQTLTELRKSISEEKKQVELLRAELASQQSAIRDQEAEAGRLRSELNQLQREEATIQDKIQANQRRLQAIETENKQHATRVEETQKAMSKMESYKKEIQQVLDHYQASEENPDSGVPEPDIDFVKDLISRSPTVISGDGFSSGTDDSSIQKLNAFPAFSGPSTTAAFTSSAFADPFFDSKSKEVDLFNSADPFGSGQDPFTAPVIGNVQASSVDKSKQSSFGAFDDFFSKSNDPFTSSSAFGENNSNKDFVGFDTDPFTNAFSTKNEGGGGGGFDSQFGDPFGNSPWTSSSIAPPPRPPKGPPSRGPPTADSSKAFDPFTGPAVEFSTSGRSKDRHSQHKKGSGAAAKPSSNTTTPGLSESDQLRWAKEESERIAKLEESARRKEEEDLQLAIRLSQMETKKGSKKK